MNGIVVLVSLAAIGIDYGWQPLPDGQLEYIVQIEPGLLEELKSGEEIVSEILPEARNVRRFRIRVGTGEVPRVGHGGGDTAPRNPAPENSRGTSGNTSAAGEFSVLPSQPHSDSSPPPSGEESRGNFGPEGFLNLPPPPPLLGPDGKNSVLVPRGGGSKEPKPRAGGSEDILPPDVSGGGAGGSASDRSDPAEPEETSDSSSSDSAAGQSEQPSGGGSEDILPPDVSGGGTGGSASGRSDPAEPEGTSDSSSSDSTAGQSEERSGSTGSLNPPQFGGSVYPPATGRDSPPSEGSGGMVLPPNSESASDRPGEGTSRSSDQNPVRPVREPNPDSEFPNPIRFGESGVKAPGANSKATHGPDPAPSASRQKPSSGEKERRNGREELVANANETEPKDDSEAAAFKPSMDKETAEKLESKPWTPLVLTSLALFASLAANAYLGWVALGIYRRYRDIVSQLHQTQTIPT
ncbi:MAG: hypothetical protein ACQESR_17935 [Planctomycetota bacterium]